jgi:hypothetical protein
MYRAVRLPSLSSLPYPLRDILLAFSGKGFSPLQHRTDFGSSPSHSPSHSSSPSPSNHIVLNCNSSAPRQCHPQQPSSQPQPPTAPLFLYCHRFARPAKMDLDPTSIAMVSTSRAVEGLVDAGLGQAGPASVSVEAAGKEDEIGTKQEERAKREGTTRAARNIRRHVQSFEQARDEVQEGASAFPLSPSSRTSYTLSHRTDRSRCTVHAKRRCLPPRHLHAQ